METADDMSIGALTAPLHLIEFASATCSHCAHFHETNWALLKSNYIDTGAIRFTMRELPTPPAQVAFAMFQLARCGGADGPEYFRRLDILFERQRDILGTGTMGGVVNALLALGADWNLGEEQVMASFQDSTGVDRIHRLSQSADAMGVTGTPTFFIDGARIEDEGFFEPDGMKAFLDARLS